MRRVVPSPNNNHHAPSILTSGEIESDSGSYGTDSELEEIADGGALLSSIGRNTRPHHTSKKGRKPRYMDFDCAECDSTPICAKGLCSRCYQRSRKQQLNATNAKKVTTGEKSSWIEPFAPATSSSVSNTTLGTNPNSIPSPHNVNVNLQAPLGVPGTSVSQNILTPPFSAGETLVTLGGIRRKCYPCPHCHKPFLKPSQTARHVRTHTGEKPFACPHMQCSRSFAEKGNLRRHLKMHTGEKPYQCSVCGRKFSRRSHLSEHLKAKNFDSHHGAPLPIQYAALLAPRANVPEASAENPDEDDSLYSTEGDEGDVRKPKLPSAPSLQERRATAELVKLATPVARPLEAPNNGQQVTAPVGTPVVTPRVENAADTANGKPENEAAAQRRLRLQLALQQQLEQHPQLLQQCSAEQLHQYLLQQLSTPHATNFPTPPTSVQTGAS